MTFPRALDRFAVEWGHHDLSDPVGEAHEVHQPSELLVSHRPLDLRSRSVGRFRKVGTTGGPPIFSPAWTLHDVTDPQVLAHAIRTGTPDDRAYALTKLVALRDPASVDVLREVVEHAHGNDELYVRKGVVALGNFDTPASIATLIDIARHRDSIMREAAVRALGRLRAPSAIPILVDLIAYPSEPVRAAALTALGRIGDPASAAAIAAALDDPDMVVRHCARKALIKLGATEALKHNPGRLLPLRAFDASRARAIEARRHTD
jgi:HEAT repeat protein